MSKSNEPLYLILHKVRGEPAFDIAAPMEVAGDQWWIIPTSGHRAYPWGRWPLENLVDERHRIRPAEAQPPPADWPDHYGSHESDPPFNLKQLVDYINSKGDPT